MAEKPLQCKQQLPEQHQAPLPNRAHFASGHHGAHQCSQQERWCHHEPHAYSAQQVRMAWELMCRGDKDGLRKQDVDLLIRTFRPNMTHSEFEQLIGPIKGRVTFSHLRSMLQTDALAADFDPVLAAFRIFDRDHSSFISADELMYYVSQVPGIGKLDKDDVHVIMKLVDKDKDGQVSVEDFRAFLDDALQARPSSADSTAVLA